MAVAVEDLKQRLTLSAVHQKDWSAEETKSLKRCFDAAYTFTRAHSDADLAEEFHPIFDEAVLVLASRLWARVRTPEGVAGFGDLGVVRVLSRDPDYEALLDNIRVPNMHGA